MSESLTKRDRLARVLGGQEVDRPPLSLWRHFYVEETDVEPLVGRLALWHRRFDFDFAKINVRAQYHSEAWGCAYRYSGQEHAKPVLVEAAVTRAADFAGLAALDPWSWPLGDMLDVISGLRSELGDDEVLLMTVFNPMSVALDLAGGAENLAAAIADDPAAVHRGLRAITDTFRDFAMLCLEQGADGLFFATTHAATAANFTLEQVEEFGRPYDMDVLDAVDGAFLNMLHVCKSQAYVRELADYPVQAINWDTSDASNPPLAALRPVAGDKALVGGLSRELFAVEGGGEALVRELEAARAATGDRRFIAGSTCTIPTETLEANVDAVCRAVRA